MVSDRSKAPAGCHTLGNLILAFRGSPSGCPLPPPAISRGSTSSNVSRPHAGTSTERRVKAAAAIGRLEANWRRDGNQQKHVGLVLWTPKEPGADGASRWRFPTTRWEPQKRQLDPQQMSLGRTSSRSGSSHQPSASCWQRHVVGHVAFGACWPEGHQWRSETNAETTPYCCKCLSQVSDGTMSNNLSHLVQNNSWSHPASPVSLM